MKVLHTKTQIKVGKAVKLALENQTSTAQLKNFSKSLKKVHSILTKTDIEIACFIVLGKTRKEIADLRGVTISSVKTSRHRLRKKLRLPNNILLDDYLKSFLNKVH